MVRNRLNGRGVDSSQALESKVFLDAASSLQFDYVNSAGEATHTVVLTLDEQATAAHSPEQKDQLLQFAQERFLAHAGGRVLVNQSAITVAGLTRQDTNDSVQVVVQDQNDEVVASTSTETPRTIGRGTSL